MVLLVPFFIYCCRITEKYSPGLLLFVEQKSEALTNYWPSTSPASPLSSCPSHFQIEHSSLRKPRGGCVEDSEHIRGIIKCAPINYGFPDCSSALELQQRLTTETTAAWVIPHAYTATVLNTQLHHIKCVRILRIDADRLREN